MPPRGRQLYFAVQSAPDPLFKASKGPFLTLRVASPSALLHKGFGKLLSQTLRTLHAPTSMTLTGAQVCKHAAFLCRSPSEGTTLREALRERGSLRGLCGGLSEGSAGLSPRVLRSSAGFCEGPRDFPRFFGGSDPMAYACDPPELLEGLHT